MPSNVLPFYTSNLQYGEVDSLKPIYSDVSIKNIVILPNRQYIANTADSTQEQYS